MMIMMMMVIGVARGRVGGGVFFRNSNGQRHGRAAQGGHAHLQGATLRLIPYPDSNATDRSSPIATSLLVIPDPQ
jgi:hypothetical protein